MHNLLIVDDEENVLSSLELAMRKHYKVFCAATGTDAIDLFRKHDIHIVFLDLVLKDMDGIEVLKKMKTIHPQAEIVIITAKSDISIAVNAIKKGAYDFVTKPYEIKRLQILAENVSHKLKLQNELSFLKETHDDGLHSIVGDCQAIKSIRKLIKKIASLQSTVLISGESGTGKEIVARMIHNSGKFKNKPFVAVNCGAIPEGIIESELFGHEKGAFTSAHSRKIGKFEYAREGTIFLDEISTMPLSLQVKLLRVLQEKIFTRVGGTQQIQVDARIMAATNTDLKNEVSKGNFREDLYYRLNVVNIDLPPLRERISDIPLLAQHFLKKDCKQFHKNIQGISDEAIKALTRYYWPGNIRELQNIVERAVVLSEDTQLTLKDLPIDFSIPGKFNQNPVAGFPETKKKFDHMEREFLINILKDCNWNKIKAAKILGVHRNTILYKTKKLNIHKGLS